MCPGFGGRGRLGRAGNTTIFLARYAAAAVSPPGHLARAISTVLVATALGATLGLLLLGPTAALASALHLPTSAGLYLLATATHIEAIGEIAMGAGAAVSAPLAATVLSSGLKTVWLLEAVLAALAATALASHVRRASQSR